MTTSMTPENRSTAAVARLADAVARLFRQGIRLNDAAWHFINSTCGHPTPEMLEAVLSDTSHPERETLLELIFFPDADQQAVLEDEIASGGFTGGSEAAVLARLTRNPLEAHLIIPQDPKTLRVAVPKWAASAFLSRLHIGKAIDPRLPAAVDPSLPESVRMRVRVALRNSRFDPSEKKIRFLCNFFRETAAGDDDFLPMVDFVLGFLGDVDDGAGIYRALVDRKRSCFRSLQQAMKFEEQLERHNIETLLLQGVRAPHIDKAEMRRTTAWIDRICHAVFGRTEPVGDAAAEQLMDLDGGGDMAGLIRSLS
jgi:hypothetical protein